MLGGIHAALFSDSSRAQSFTAEAKLMGTVARVTTVGGTPELAEQIVEYLHHLDAVWSRFEPHSEISELNKHQGVPFAVSEDTRELVALMIAGHARTLGSFDPTLLPALLDEGYTSSLVNPDKTTVLPAHSLGRGDPQGIHITGNTITLPRGTTLDSGGAGKGFAADRAAVWARGKGALGVLVDVGGDVRVSGLSPRADSWRLAIEHPQDSTHRLSVVALADSGVATSTTTKRRFSVEGRETHHLIDPQTLRSSESDVNQATVIAPTAADAEIATKIAFSRNYAALFAYANRHSYQAGCLLNTGEWLTTKGWPQANA